MLADAEARWKDYGDALRYLDAAERLGGGTLGERWAKRRRRWERAREEMRRLRGGGRG